MKKLILLSLVCILLAGCGPSEADIQQAIEQTQAAAPTIGPTETLRNLLIQPTDPNAPTKVPYKSPTPKPTKTARPTSKPTNTPNVDKIVNDTIAGLEELIIGFTETESITMIRPGKEAFEIEVKTSNYAKDSQPDISFEIAKILGEVFGTATETQLLHFIDGYAEKFSVIITTYSAEGKYKYQSRTYYDTLIKLYNKRITYDEWVQESNAGFMQ